MPSLILITEDSPRQVFQLGRATLMVGRDNTSEIQVPDDSVSRNHASIVVEDHCFIVRDNGSTNGTFVNGQSISRHILKHHDILRFGSCLFLVDMKDKKGPQGTEIITHLSSKKGNVVQVNAKSLIPGSPVEPVKLVLSSSPRKTNKSSPPVTIR